MSAAFGLTARAPPLPAPQAADSAISSASARGRRIAAHERQKLGRANEKGILRSLEDLKCTTADEPVHPLARDLGQFRGIGDGHPVGERAPTNGRVVGALWLSEALFLSHVRGENKPNCVPLSTIRQRVRRRSPAAR